MSKYITVTRDGRVAAPVYGGLVERGAWIRGTPLRAMHQHPGSIPLYLIKTTNTPSTLNQHPFVLIEARVSIRIAARRMHVSDAISSTGGPRSGVGRERAGERNSRRSREMLLMPRGQRDKHTHGKRRPVDLYLSSSRLAARARACVRGMNDERR